MSLSLDLHFFNKNNYKMYKRVYLRNQAIIYDNNLPVQLKKNIIT